MQSLGEIVLGRMLEISPQVRPQTEPTDCTVLESEAGEGNCELEYIELVLFHGSPGHLRRMVHNQHIMLLCRMLVMNDMNVLKS